MDLSIEHNNRVQIGLSVSHTRTRLTRHKIIFHIYGGVFDCFCFCRLLFNAIYLHICLALSLSLSLQATSSSKESFSVFAFDRKQKKEAKFILARQRKVPRLIFAVIRFDVLPCVALNKSGLHISPIGM